MIVLCHVSPLYPPTSFLLKGRENGKTRGHMEEGEIGRDKEKRERERERG